MDDVILRLDRLIIYADLRNSIATLISRGPDPLPVSLTFAELEQAPGQVIERERKEAR